MRKPKRILLYCASESTVGMTAYVLRTHGYRVMTEGTPYVAVALFRAGIEVDCAVMVHTAADDGCDEVAQWLFIHQKQTPVLLIDRVGDKKCGGLADRTLHPPETGSAEMLAAVKRLCIRKRGPKSVGQADKKPQEAVA